MSEAGTPGTGGTRGSARAAADGTANGRADGARADALPRDPAALEKLISVRREHLAATVDELVVRAQPQEIARRGAQDVTARVRAAVTAPDGRLRLERIGAVAAAVATVLALIIWRRRSR